MQYTVNGVRTQQVSVTVEADSEEEALELAESVSDFSVDCWDSDTQWFSAWT